MPFKITLISELSKSLENFFLCSSNITLVHL